jgi:hypothetical protein
MASASARASFATPRPSRLLRTTKYRHHLHRHRRRRRTALASSSSSSPSPSPPSSPPPSAPDAAAARRSPFPIERFEDADVATAGRFLWASRGLTRGTGLKPLDAASDWLEQDADSNDWTREMRKKHALIDEEPRCVAWDDASAASRAAETVLRDACDWLTRRQPRRYRRDPDGGVSIPELDGWSTGPLDALKGEDALRAAAKLVQEELCLVKETTREDADADAGGDVPVDVETAHVFEAGVVCFSFDATKRRGKTLGDIHVPVPGYEEKMRTAVARVFAGLKHDKPLWRANWALQNSGARRARVLLRKDIHPPRTVQLHVL